MAQWNVSGHVQNHTQCKGGGGGEQSPTNFCTLDRDKESKNDPAPTISISVYQWCAMIRYYIVTIADTECKCILFCFYRKGT